MTSLNDISLHDIQSNFDAEVVEKATQLWDEGLVEDYGLDPKGVLGGEIVEGRKRYFASLTVRNNALQMMCECGKLSNGPCAHVLALLIAFVSEAGAAPQEPDLPISAASPSPARLAPPQLFPTPTHSEIRADWQKHLQELTVKDLREIAAARGFKLKGLRREEVLDGLLEIVLRPDALAAAVNQLQPDARRLLDLLCVLPATMPPFVAYQYDPYIAAALDNGLKSRRMEECLLDLKRLGLYLVPAMPYFYPVPLQALAAPLPNPDLFKKYSGEPERVTAVQPFQFTRLAVRLLLLAQGGRLQCAELPRGVAQGGWPLKTETDRAAAETEILAEPAYLETGLRDNLARSLKLPAQLLDLAARLLEYGGLWLKRMPQKLSERVPVWLELSPQEQSRRLFALAAGFPAQVDLDLARSSGFAPWRSRQNQFNYADFLAGLGFARLRLVQLLARTPQGQWLDVDSILHTLHGLQPGWMVEFQSRQGGQANERFMEKAPLWALAEKRRVNPLVYDDWLKAYGQFYLTMLGQTLPYLGLVDAGWQGTRLVAVRLAEFGEFLIGRRADFAMPAAKAERPALTLRLDGLFELDLDAASLDLINLLMQIATPETAARDSRLLYRLNERGMGRAFENGWTLENLTGQLEISLGARLPAELLGRLQTAWDHFGRLQIYEDMALIELADDFALPELLAGTRLSQILLYTFSPRLVAVQAAEVEKFVAEIQAKGYTPRLEGNSRG